MDWLPNTRIHTNEYNSSVVAAVHVEYSCTSIRTARVRPKPGIEQSYSSTNLLVCDGVLLGDELGCSTSERGVHLRVHGLAFLCAVAAIALLTSPVRDK